MKEVIVSLFGEYLPTMTTEIIDGLPVEVVASGVAGVDWQWLAGVFLFGLVLFSLFRLIGVLMK